MLAYIKTSSTKTYTGSIYPSFKFRLRWENIGAFTARASRLSIVLPCRPGHDDRDRISDLADRTISVHPRGFKAVENVGLFADPFYHDILCLGFTPAFLTACYNPQTLIMLGLALCGYFRGVSFQNLGLAPVRDMSGTRCASLKQYQER